MFFSQAVEVEARPGYKIWVKYADGPEGVVDLSGLVGQGPYAAWNDPDFFKGVHISEMKVIAWENDIDICPDAVYLELTGLPFDQVFKWMKEPPVIGWMIEDTEVPASALPKLVEVKACEGYRIWVRFDDGVSGEVDLSHLVGKGVFKAWDDPEFFKGVYVDEGHAIAWSEEIDMCPDAAYMEVTGLTVEEVFPEFFEASAGA